MPMILALDQGTTSSRSVLFRADGRPVAIAQQEYPQLYPRPAHVEHNPEDIWSSQIATAHKAIASAGGVDDVVAVGIANQRETTLVWDHQTGQPIGNAIVWQSRISGNYCERLRRDGYGELVQEKTGLLIDPYFSATKLQYLLDTVSGLRERAERGEIAFGTVDSFLIWRLTGGAVHVTDISNASRTMLFNIHTRDWDDELLSIMGIPRAMLPEVRSNAELLGETTPDLFGKRLPIMGCAGDQQAATFGQACFATGDAKNTYGTGCFMLMNAGSDPPLSERGLLTTVGWELNGEVTYCLEGSIFIAGAAVQWLRDGLGVIETSADVGPLAATVDDADGVYFVPAFVGLGAPYWDSDARGTIVGLTRATTKGHIARATIESMAFQTYDVLQSMQADSGIELACLRVDGGATACDALLQFQADLLNVDVLRATVQETTAQGAAYFAGLASGIWGSLDELKQLWASDREFQPQQSTEWRASQLHGWHNAVSCVRHWSAGTRQNDAPEQ